MNGEYKFKRFDIVYAVERIDDDSNSENSIKAGGKCVYLGYFSDTSYSVSNLDMSMSYITTLDNLVSLKELRDRKINNLLN
jgi:hypothetical protein